MNSREGICAEFGQNYDTRSALVLSNCLQALNIFYDLLNNIFDDFGMIARLYDRVQLSIYSTRALFHVAMKYWWIHIFFYFERKSTFKQVSRMLDCVHHFSKWSFFKGWSYKQGCTILTWTSLLCVIYEDNIGGQVIVTQVSTTTTEVWMVAMATRGVGKLLGYTDVGLTAHINVMVNPAPWRKKKTWKYNTIILLSSLVIYKPIALVS